MVKDPKAGPGSEQLARRRVCCEHAGECVGKVTEVLGTGHLPEVGKSIVYSVYFKPCCDCFSGRQSDSEMLAGRRRERDLKSPQVLFLFRRAPGLTTCPILTICMEKADVWGKRGQTLGPAPILRCPTHADGLALPINTLIALVA